MITQHAAKLVFKELLKRENCKPEDVDDIIKELNLKEPTEEEMFTVVRQVIADNSGVVKQYIDGNSKCINQLINKVLLIKPGSDPKTAKICLECVLEQTIKQIIKQNNTTIYEVLPHERNKFAHPDFVDGAQVVLSPSQVKGKPDGWHTTPGWVTVRLVGANTGWYGMELKNLRKVV